VADGCEHLSAFCPLVRLPKARYSTCDSSRLYHRMDYYEELGISRTAGEQEIRRAYHRIAKLLHPDQHADFELKALAELQMMRMNGIFEILLDPVKRRGYGLLLQNALVRDKPPADRSPESEPVVTHRARWMRPKRWGLAVLVSSVLLTSVVLWSLSRSARLIPADSAEPRNAEDFHFPAIGFDPKKSGPVAAVGIPIAPQLRSPEVSLSLKSAGPHLVRAVPPEYPPEAREERIEGVVQFVATVAKDGKVEALDLVGGPTLLRAAARQAVLQWQYQPALADGNPVEAKVEADVLFRLP
jgi:TonB family protein